jgi:hypothetical protein
MNEKILVEFMINASDYDILDKKIKSIGDSFENLKEQFEFEIEPDEKYSQWFRVTGKIDSMTASMLRLSDPFFDKHMKVSYISKELKDKYRK